METTLDQPAAGDALFDSTRYQQPVPTLDGHRADTLKLAFAGAVEIDLMIEDDLTHTLGLAVHSINEHS